MKNSRGRPAKTSREEILDAACAQLQEKPFEDLSLSALARSMSLTPMALYRYFTDKNDLQQTIAERLLAAIVIDFEGCTTWQMKVQRWTTVLWRDFHDSPHLMRCLGWQGHTATAWIRQVALLAGVLKEAGFASAELAMAMKWISVSVVGIINTAVSRAQHQVQLGQTDFPFNDALVAETIVPMLTDLAVISDEIVFQHHVTQMIAQLETVLTATSPDSGKRHR